MTAPTDMMPIVLPGPTPRDVLVYRVPMALFRPHEAQARSNHGGQSLDRLAERGGLGVGEAVAILEDRPWRKLPTSEAVARLRDFGAGPEA